MIQQADEDITEGCIGTRWGPISKTVPRPDENAKISQFSGASPLGTGPLFFGQIGGGGRPNEVFFKTYQFTGASPPRLPIQNMQSWPTGGLKRLLGTSPSTCANPMKFMVTALRHKSS